MCEKAKKFIPVYFQVRLVPRPHSYSQMNTSGSGWRAEFLAIKLSMTTVDYEQLPTEGGEYTADIVGSTWPQECRCTAEKLTRKQNRLQLRVRGM